MSAPRRLMDDIHVSMCIDVRRKNQHPENTRDVIPFVSYGTSFGTLKFGDVVAALNHLTDEMVIDREVLALDREGKPSFNLLQNVRSMESHRLLRIRCARA